MIPPANRDPADSNAPSDGPSLDERTVAVLDRLRNRTEPISLADLAADVADHGPHPRGGSEVGAAPDIHRVRIRLHHVELPGLDEAGFLDYDAGERLVAPRERANRDPPSTDTMFELLAHRYRRAVLDCLDEQRPLAVPELAAEVARREPDHPTQAIPPAAIDRIHAALQHTHLPKLQQAGAVRIGPTDGLVTAGENAVWLLSALRALGTTRAGGSPPFR